MPKVSNAPKALNALLEKVYASALKEYKGDKGKASATAWAAAKEAGWKKVKGKWTKAKKTAEHSVPVKEHVLMETGTFKTKSGEVVTVTDKDFDEMCETFNPDEPPAYIPGHTSDWPGTTMIPKLGEIKGALKRAGNKLIAVGAEFTDRLAGWIKEGFYDQRSCETYKENGKMHLGCIAMLGMQPPAIKGMPPITADMLQSDLMFSKPTGLIEFVEGGDVTESIDLSDHIDEVEQAGKDSVKKDIAECLAELQNSLEEMIDEDEDQDRMVQEVYEHVNDLCLTLNIHNSFMERLEDLEEEKEGEYSFIKKIFKEFGGEGSGNFGHEGRPGEVGGSGEGGGKELKESKRMKNFTAKWNGGDAHEQVEEILLNNNIKYDELESPTQRANGSHAWLASYKSNPIAEVKLEESKIGDTTNGDLRGDLSILGGKLKDEHSSTTGFWQEFAEYLKKHLSTNNQKESIDMDKEQEQKYLKQIADLENEKKEFAEKIRVADEAKAKEAEKVADTQLRATISEFCATNKLNTNKHKDLKIEEILFAAAKANQTIEFATKPSEGGGIPSIATEKKPLFVVLQDALKSFQIATPPEGEMHEFNQSFPDNKKNDKSSMRIQQAEEYAKSHPAEFSECENDTQKIAKALRLEINQQIQFKPIQ